MRCSLFSLCVLISRVFALDYNPWLEPLWELEAKLGYDYSHVEHVQSPVGSFKYIDNEHSVSASLGMTLWPDVNVEGELGFIQSDIINFSYKVFAGTMRVMLLDDLYGDCITMTSGVTIAFPPQRILYDFNYPYHGYINIEAHLALGKELRTPVSMEWALRLWALIGYGVAEKGSPWIHGIIALDRSLSKCSYFSLYIETMNGLGGANIISEESFRGYASINHQTIDLASAYHYDLGIYAQLSLRGYINLHARNFTEHTFGCSVLLTIPIGI